MPLNGTLSHLSPDIISKHHFSSSFVVKLFPLLKSLEMVDLLHLGNVKLYFIRVHKVFIWIARSVQIFYRKCMTIMSTPVPLCADKNDLFIFSGRQRQQMRQSGQSRPTEKCKTLNCIKHCFVKSTMVKRGLVHCFRIVKQLPSYFALQQIQE